MSAPTAKVLRDGQIVQIPGREVVPGDVVILEAGDSVCADGRLLECASLKCAESALTGESLPVEKDTEPLSGETALGDRKNMVFSGSLVTYGRATVLVTGTGMDTELGKIAALMNQTQQRKTPLQISLDDFSRRLAIIILVICAGVFALSLSHADSTGFDAILDSLMFAVALAVAAIPEALSSIVTIVQAMGTQKMARQNAIIKELKAVETLGAVSVICSDKTGTLTKAQPTLHSVIAFGEEKEDDLLCLAACLEEHFPHSMAKAVVRAAAERNLEHEEVHSKVEYIVAHGISSFMEEKRVVIGSYHFVFEDEQCVIPEGKEVIFNNLPEECSCLYMAIDQQLAAVICIEDPVREEAADVIRDLRDNGIQKIVMMTGDSERTAAAIAHKVGVDEYYSEVLPEDKANFCRAGESTWS